jgi:hypothetical protein
LGAVGRTAFYLVLIGAIVDPMADGQAVLVITEPLGGGEPEYTLCYVAEPDAAKAEQIVATLAAPNEKVKALGRIPEAAIQAFGLRRGEFRHA